MANPITTCGEAHPIELACPQCVRLLDLRAKCLATPVYDLFYLQDKLRAETPALRDATSLREVLQQRGYDNDTCIVIDVDDALDDTMSHGDSWYPVWVRAMIALLGEHEVRNAYFRIGE